MKSVQNLRIQSKYRKIRTRNNYVFGHFSHSVSNFTSSKKPNMNWNFKKKKIIFKFSAFSFIFRFHFRKNCFQFCVQIFQISFFAWFIQIEKNRKQIHVRLKFFFNVFLQISRFFDRICSVTTTAVDISGAILLWLQES